MNISAMMVKELRDKTGVGFSTCKEALVETNGNMEEAVDYLRKKGLASVNKYAGRAASEGLVVPVISDDRRSAAIVEVNCVTDFAAKSEGIVNFANKLAALALNSNVTTVEEFEKLTLDGQTVAEHRAEIISQTHENVTISRVQKVTVPAGENGLFDKYSHNGGAIGVLVQMKTNTAEAAADEQTVALTHQIALQAASMKPLYTFKEQVPQEAIEREKNVVLGQLANDPKNAKKPEAVIQKIVEGRLNKYYAENCLYNQEYFNADNKETIADLINGLNKKLNAEVSLVTYIRWARGEAAETAKAEEEKSAEAGA